jgi:hypothetical protein
MQLRPRTDTTHTPNPYYIYKPSSNFHDMHVYVCTLLS